jgi:hypothetical protein
METKGSRDFMQCIYLAKRKVGYVYRLYTTHNQCIVTLLSRHVSALLGHHQVTKAYNYDIKVIPIQRIRCYNMLIDV